MIITILLLPQPPKEVWAPQGGSGGGVHMAEDDVQGPQYLRA